MRRRGSISRYSRLLTFGGRVPASVGLLLVVMLFASVWGWQGGRALLGAVALQPVGIVRGEVWRLVSWPFFNDFFSLLFAGFMLVWLGQQLSYVWSEQRFFARFFGYTIGASVGTTLVAFVWPTATGVSHTGVWPIVNAFIVAWAMLYPDRQVNVWGVLPLTGRTLALLVAAGTVLYGISMGVPAGFAVVSPHLFALAIAWVQARGLGLGRGFGQARQWWSEQQRRRRARHLNAVRKDGQGDRPRWLN